MSNPMDRRRLLQLILALGASGVVHDKVALAADSRCRTSLFGGLELASIQQIGREYLATQPDGSAIRAVAGLLAGSATDAEALAELRQKMQADFTAGRVLNLSGWFVSETEGCVFAALSRCDGAA